MVITYIWLGIRRKIHLLRFFCSLLIILNASWGVVSAQTNPNKDLVGTEWNMWGGGTLEISFSEKTEFTLNYLRAYNLGGPIQNSFNQGSAFFTYKFNKHLDGKAGIMLSQFPASDKNTYRYCVRGSYKVWLGDRINWTNGIQAERHSVNENRFDYRVIYITRFGLSKRLDFLRLAPSVSYWLYYNIGGSRIQYYDDFGQPSVKESSVGVHRGRLIINLNSKVSDVLSISAYYLRQHEFNLITADRGINVVNPGTGKITRPFNNYNVIGMSLKINLDL